MSASLKEYWDYSPAERAAMPEERVDDLLSIELMAKGVVRPEPPHLEVIEHIEVARVTMYGIKYDNHHDLGVLFATADDASKCLALLPRRIENDWQSDIKIAQQFVGTIEPVEIFSEADLVMKKRALVRNKERKAANEKAQNEFNKANQIVTKACDKIWSDWRQQRSTLKNMERIRDVAKQYMDTAGDVAIAMRFLLKAYTREQITESMEWADWKATIPDDTVSPEPKPKEGYTASDMRKSDEVDF